MTHPRISEKSQFLLGHERREYDRFCALATSGKWLDVLERVVRHAVVVEIGAEGENDPGFGEAAALLDGTVVQRGAGLAAVNALARFFQSEASRSGLSTPERWLRVLDEAGIAPGPISAEASAGRSRILAGYRRRLAACRDLLDVDHFAVGVPPMRVDELMDTFKVELPRSKDSERPDTADLAHVARRWPRFVVLGLPGSGKTTAVEQLAAVWADDIDAPIPILVRLHALVGALRDGSRVELEDVVAAGNGVAGELVPLLAERLREGNAALLLDGLDECHDQQGAAVGLIRRIANDIHVDSGLIVAARDAVSQAAKGTELPLTLLQEPERLMQHIRALVDHVFVSVGSADGESISRVREWVADSQSRHRDVWQIPLFATLLGVQAAQMEGGELPASRAAALVSAIQGSVTRWEKQKAYTAGAWREELRPELLLQGFGDIGHLVTAGATDIVRARASLAAGLADGWNFGRVEAEAVAGDVLRWWVDRVGVFVVTDGQLRARVRMMGEVGDAMWAARHSRDDRRDWLQWVVSDVSGNREPALLATSLERAVTDELIEAVSTPDGVLLAVDAVLEGSAPSQSALVALVDKLVNLVANPMLPRSVPAGPAQDDLFGGIDERQQRYDGPAWRYLEALVKLPLPPDLRIGRDQVIAEVGDEERRAVVRALAIGADCLFDKRCPTDAEMEVLEMVLALPVPEKEPVEYRRSRRYFSVGGSEPILSGRGDATVGAIRLIGLTPESAARSAQLAMRLSASSADALTAAINRAGFGEEIAKMWKLGGAFERLQRFMEEDFTRDERFILEAASSTPVLAMADPIGTWRLCAAAALLEALGASGYRAGTSIDAVDRYPTLVKHLVQMARSAAGYPLGRVVREAEQALALLDADRLGTSILLNLRSDPLQNVSPSNPVVNEHDVFVLRECLIADNDWLFWLAAEWIASSGNDRANVIWEAMPSMTSAHRGDIAVWVATATARTDAYARWLEGDDPSLRVAAARGLTEGGFEVDIRALATDADLSVRLAALRALAKAGKWNHFEEVAALALETSPEVWTCKWCGSIESMQNWDCTSCTTGDRRDLAEEIASLRNDPARR
jgi:hypothetical protein